MGSHVSTTPEHVSPLVNITVTPQCLTMEKLVVLSFVYLVIAVSAFSPGFYHKHKNLQPYRRGSYNRSPSVFQTFKHGLNSLLFGPIQFKIISNRPKDPPEDRTCERDRDCRPIRLCEDGVCVRSGCDFDEDCTNGRYCNGRRCVFGRFGR